MRRKARKEECKIELQDVRNVIPVTGENMQKLLDECSDEELVVILRYIQAQLKDELVRRLKMQDPTNYLKMNLIRRKARKEDKPMPDTIREHRPAANPVYPMVKEVRTEKNPDVIIELLSSGDWVALNAVDDRGVMKLMLGRVNPSSEARAELKRRLLPCCHDLQQYPE